MAALWDSPKALDYLRGRGLEDDTILDAELGLVPDDAPKYRGWLAIPYKDGQGRWRTTRYRTLPPSDKAYRSEKGGVKHLYNVAAVESPTVAVCEGEFDSLILTQLGVPAVALPGVNTWQREWRYLFRNCDLVYVIVDHAPRDKEEARSAERRAANSLRATIGLVADVEVVELPEGMDVTDLYLADRDRLKELIT